MSSQSGLKQNFPLWRDMASAIVIFLVALPLCLGIALASGAPLLSGLIAGVVGGLLVAVLSGAQLSVSGPAAGLTVIVVSAIEKLGSFPLFCSAVILAGLIQIGLGYAGAGIIGTYFPVSVIRGMLAAIGLVLIMKQIPHALGYDKDFEGDESFAQPDQHTTFTEILYSLNALTPSAILVSLVSLIILTSWESRWLKKIPLISKIPGPLIAVAWGMGFNLTSKAYWPEWAIQESHRVQLPLYEHPFVFFDALTLPDLSAALRPDVLIVAITLAIIASLETLLSIEAVDKIDPLKRTTPANRELKAQGVGNMVSGLLGGLPITSVIVRSSANVNAGGLTWRASFFHGLLLIFSLLFMGKYLNEIPLSCLASLLILTGYKLSHPKIYLEMLARGQSQFAPFILTITAILLTDLLKGMAIGIAVGLFFVIRNNFESALLMTQEGQNYLLKMRKDVSFLNKAPLRQMLSSIQPESSVIIDGTRAHYIDDDIIDALVEFSQHAERSAITIEFKNISIPESYQSH